MQVGDIITLIDENKQEVEVEVMKVYSGKDEGTQKPSILADLRETATDRIHNIVPQKQFVKGARVIQYYLERPPEKTTPTPVVKAPKVPDVVPEPVTPEVVAEPDLTPEPAPVVATPPKGKNKSIGVGDNVATVDK